MIFVFSQSHLFAQKIAAKMMVQGKLREFIVVKPSGTAPPGGYPLVFMLHGTGGDGEKFYNISKWVERGEADKIVTVFPSSLKWCHKEKNGPVEPSIEKWVNGDLLDGYCGDTNDLISEELFFRRMVDTISKVLQINSKKMYVAGFSNGSSMTQKLLVQASDLFSAYGAHAGSLNALDTARVKRKVPLMFSVGTLDQAYTGGVGIPVLPFNDSTLHYLAGPISRALSVLDLETNYTLYANSKTRSYVFNTPKPGAEPTTYIFTLIKDAEHVYPNGILHELMMADIHWEFFKTLSLPTSLATAVEEGSLDKIARIFPNPAADHINVSALSGGRSPLNIVNALGEVVLSIPSKGQSTIDVSALSSGRYSIIAGSQRENFVVVR